MDTKPAQPRPGCKSSLGASVRPDDGTVGLYVHVPFCERICPYCDFAVVAARPLDRATEERTVAALERELRVRGEGLAHRTLASVYFGGGTPALLSPDSLARLVEAAHGAFEKASDGRTPEVTLEANPSTVERERLPHFRAAGVNRLSLGVQSFDDAVLKRLGRAHRGVEGRRTLEAARAAAFDSISVDLIWAVPGAPEDAPLRDLAVLEAHRPEHLSAYELTIEEGTPFGLARERGQLEPLDDDDVVALGGRIAARAAAAGLERYEVSSYARPGFEARHNRRYWRREPVLGIGLGAWSSLPPSEEAPFGAREANERALDAWLAGVERVGHAVSEREVFDAATARGEAAFLGLRELREGLDLAAFEAEFGAPLRTFHPEALDALVRDGLVVESDDRRLRLTSRGRWLADTVAAAFV